MTRQTESESSHGAPGRIRLVDVLGAFSLAGDLAIGQQPEHGARSCYIGMQIADTLALPNADRRVLF
ncbi:MAG: metal-dependent phosphohydrolase, partial [Dehalococcoidia bacterium]